MEKMFEELKTVLSEELKIHTDCVKTAGDMNKAIKEKNVDSVQRLTNSFDISLAQIEIIETRRLDLCDTITRALQPHSRHLSLQNIIALLPEEEQAFFIEIRTSLKKKISELAAINTSNQLLLKESLVAIGKNFELFAESQNRHAGYKQTGTMATQSVRRNIVNHVA